MPKPSEVIETRDAGREAKDGTGEHVLVVEDDEQELRSLLRVLNEAGFESTGATSAKEAHERLAEHDFALVFADVLMPGGSGLNLVKDILANQPRTATVMVSGSDDPEYTEAALQLGTYGYVIKPYTAAEIRVAATNALRRRALEIDSRAHKHMLEQTVMARTEALERSANQLRLSREETISRLSKAIEYRDEETSGHTERMSRYAAVLGRQLGFDPEPIRIASPMHDVGKVALSDRILLKPMTLTPEERAEMQLHPEIGHKILHGSGSALLDLAATIAWTHHEKYDGTGYPRCLRGDDIPIEGQIAAVADVFDALTSKRPYRSAFSVDDAATMMQAEGGKHFNPRLLEAFLSSMDEVLEIKSRFT